MTLERILEPEVMDSEQEAREYNDMDHSEVNRKFVDELLVFAKSKDESYSDEPFRLGDVLDMGTGTALIPIDLCMQHPSCRIMAIDMAASMLDLAKYNVEANSLTERIQLAQVDAKKMGYEDGMFDTVISNSIIHHIPSPRECFQEMVRVTRDGGLLFVRDLMRPDDLETLQQLVQTYAGDETEVSQKLFDDSLHAALSLDEARELVVSLGFEADSVQPTSDRHWTWAMKK